MSAVTDETCPPLPPTPHFAADRPIGPNPGLAAHFTQCQSIKYKHTSGGPIRPNLDLEAQCNTAHKSRRYTNLQYNTNTNFQKTAVQAQTQDSLHTLQARQTKTLPTLQQPFSQDKANDGQTILCQRIFLYSLFSDFCAWSRRQPKHYIYEK